MRTIPSRCLPSQYAHGRGSNLLFALMFFCGNLCFVLLGVCEQGASSRYKNVVCFCERVIVFGY